MTIDEIRAIYWFRLGCSVIALVSYVGLLWRGYAFARRSQSRQRRVFWATALITLFHWVAVLALSSVYLVLHPPVLVAVDPTPTIFQTYLAAAIAFGGVLMWAYCPRPQDG